MTIQPHTDRKTLDSYKEMRCMEQHNKYNTMQKAAADTEVCICCLFLDSKLIPNTTVDRAENVKKFTYEIEKSEYEDNIL